MRTSTLGTSALHQTATDGEPDHGAMSPHDLDAQAMARMERAQALAQQPDRKAVEELLLYLGDSHPFVRWEAETALAHIADHLQGRSRLLRTLGSQRNPDLSVSEMLTLLGEQLRAEDATRRASAATALGLWRHEQALQLLTEALADPYPLVRTNAATGLGRLGDRAPVPQLIQRLRDPSAWVRRAAAEALGHIGAPQAIPELSRLVREDEELVATAAISALGHLPDPRSHRTLMACLDGEDAVLRWFALRSLVHVGDVSAIPALQRHTTDTDVFFGQSMGELAILAIHSIERRQRGLWNMMRRAFYTLHDGLVHLVRSRIGRKRAQKQQPPDGEDSGGLE
jgi:HEAT repeat protein